MSSFPALGTSPRASPVPEVTVSVNLPIWQHAAEVAALKTKFYQDRLDAEALRKRTEDENRAAEKLSVMESVTNALSDVGALWLTTYFHEVDISQRMNSDGWRLTYVRFNVPEHRVITLVLIASASTWKLAHDATGGEMPTWLAVDGNGHEMGASSLGEALVLAEGLPPIPF